MRMRLSGDSTASRFLLLVIVATLLMLVVPATVVFAQAVAIDDGDDVQYNGVCQNIIGSIDDIETGNSANANVNSNANAAADNDSEAAAEANSVAEIAQESGVSIEQVNECLNGAASGGPTNGTTDRTTDGTTGETTDGTTPRTLSGQEETAVQADVIVESIPDQKVLPNTGGLPLLTWGALTLVVATVVGIRVIGRR